MVERSEDRTINGHRFKIGRVTALDGQWIMDNLGESKDQSIYTKILNYLMTEVRIYKGDPPQEVLIYAAGRWLVPEIDPYDLDLVNAIYRACLEVNFTPFFEKRKAEMEAKKRQ